MGTEDMQEEDIGILSMMHGRNIVEDEVKQARRTCATPRKNKAGLPTIRIEECGITSDVFQSWGLNALPLSKHQRVQLAAYAINRFHDESEGFIKSQEDQNQLIRFI